ncbi:hypothetical protein ACF06X_33570 [Streptomyces sp. NPDC015346]|uniref:hypothetical protein n=1 Tax=Streptomyces sp. NPDC015346 TaxID=3364954 RepID=UPI0037025571
MAELTELQRAQRRQQARTAIETAIANAPGAETASPAVLADHALDALGDLAAEILVDGTMMRSLTIKDGIVTLELEEATEILKVYVAAMRGVLDGYGAENYVETEMTAPSVSMDLRDGSNPMDSYTVTIQRRTRPTPHEFRQRAEARLAAVLNECEAIEAELHGQHDEDDDGMRAAVRRIRVRAQGDSRD